MRQPRFGDDVTHRLGILAMVSKTTYPDEILMPGDEQDGHSHSVIPTKATWSLGILSERYIHPVHPMCEFLP